MRNRPGRLDQVNSRGLPPRSGVTAPGSIRPYPATETSSGATGCGGTARHLLQVVTAGMPSRPSGTNHRPGSRRAAAAVLCSARHPRRSDARGSMAFGSGTSAPACAEATSEATSEGSLVSTTTATPCRQQAERRQQAAGAHQHRAEGFPDTGCPPAPPRPAGQCLRAGRTAPGRPYGGTGTAVLQVPHSRAEPCRTGCPQERPMTHSADCVRQRLREVACELCAPRREPPDQGGTFLSVPAIGVRVVR